MDLYVHEFGHVHWCKLGFPSKTKNKIANIVDPDKTARNEPSYQDKHCLQRYMFWSAELKELLILLK